MMDNTFRKTMGACVGASIPCTAWSTTGEVDEIIFQAVEYAAKYGKNTPAVFVWRESVGFQQYAAFVEEENGEEVTMTSLPSTVTHFNVKPVEEQS